MLGALTELLGLVVVVGAAVAALRSLRRGAPALGPPRDQPSAGVGPRPWEPHVSAADNHTVVVVRRPGARSGDPEESLEIARFPADDPAWHDKLVTARAEATLRATELNAPY
jgi:hypothetical protein